MRTNRRVVAAGTAVAIAVAAAAVGAGPARAGMPAGAAVPRAAQPTAAAKPGAAALTLITGDRVHLVDQPGGRVAMSVLPGPGRDGITFISRGRGEDQEVLPSDAVPLVASGALDRKLFQVRRLARDGFDDAHMTALPLIVSYRGGRPAALAPAHEVRALPSIGGAALRTPKASAPAFWRSVVDSGATGARRSALGQGLAHVWLDDHVKVLDEESNVQIGVPAARALGLTGKDVPIAVLDTGVDADHPDLAGPVVASEDFTGSPDGVKDTVGHGTHVASVVAGSGAASGGRYAGVAPQARLLVGKVCRTDRCDVSAILAGMEWAVAQGARLVNLSLGAPGGDGTDPLALAVNNLTASSGALFVAAAGNIRGLGTISTPAVADAALAVGSVGRTDVLSSFSSGGPRPGDGAVKPDITGPGEGIVAARAAGTTMGDPVDARYTAASGTSMATPHVTGAAALLLQQHPDWKAADLKAALTSAAAPTAGPSTFFQGAGRVDIGRATAATVVATSGSVSFPIVRVPTQDQSSVRRGVTYRNDGDAPVTLSLSLSVTDVNGAPAPAGLLTADAATVAVPAHGSASTAVMLNPAGAGVPGLFGGVLTATAPGGVRVQTAVGVQVLPETKPLTVNLIGRDGKPASDDLRHSVQIVSADRGILPHVRVFGGRGTVELPKGRYAIVSVIQSGTPDRVDSTVVYTPFTAFDAARTVTVDARRARAVTVRTDRPDAVVRDLGVDVVMHGARNYQIQFDFGTTPIYAVPVETPAGELSFGTRAELTPASGNAYAYHLAFASADQIPAKLARRVRDRDLATVRTTYRAQGKPALASRAAGPFYLPGQFAAFGPYTTVPLPGRRTERYTAAASVRWFDSMIQRPADQPDPRSNDGQLHTKAATYAAGSVAAEEWNRAAFGPQLQMFDVGNNLVGRVGDSFVASTELFSPWEERHTSLPFLSLRFVSGSTTLTRSDGTVVATSDTPGILFTGLPPETGRYTLSTTATRSASWSALSTRVDASWTFSSGRTAPGALTLLPLLTVQPSGNLDQLNRAPGFRWFPINLRVRTQRGATAAAITDVTLDMSTDDGTTWRRGRVLGGHGDTWQAVVFNPHAGTGTGFVSLRLSATDAAGGHVEETIIRAYGLVDH